ncbi:AsmA protein [Thiogranum longum]|uniref:AsmA protein n=1 Tax=Thiogranum longum TaxID=1537524 RepID=A0A4R1HBX7_9GAMM|nr:AsmA family protein [Thiogranum longum]TCK19497.1 AsmA protein [Thiogranum longum]
MSKLIRWAGLGVGALLVLIIVAVVVLPMIIDPNDFKPEIASAVESSTGRTLTMKGDLELSVFPWLGVGIGDSALSNAKGFSSQPFAQVETVQIRVKLLPLLSRELVMDTVVLKGLKVSLETDKSGRTNWQDLAGAAAEKKPAKKETAPEPGAAPALAGLAIGGVEIEDAQLVWDDRQAGSRYQVDDLSLKTGAIGSGERVPVSLSMRVKGSGLPASGLAPELDFDVAVDIDAQTLKLSDLVFQVAGMTMEGDLSGKQIMSDASFNGKLKIREFVPRDLMAAFDVTPPETSDPAVLSRADAVLALAATPNSLKLSDIRIRLDDSTVDGSLSVANFARPAMRFGISLDTIDVDRYLPPQQETTPATPTAAAAAGAGMIPVETLRSLDLAGKLSIAELKAAQLRSRDVSMELKAKDGVVRIYPAKASLYEGSYSGDVKLDVRGKKPVISLNESLSGVQIGPLLKDMVDQDRLQGKTDISAKLTAKGQTPEAFKRTLNGNLSFTFANGAVKGVNLIRLIRKAQAILKGKPVPADNTPEQTDFSEMQGTAVVTNGVLRNDDLLIKSPLLRVDGKGTVNLPAETIDYLVTTKLVGSLEGQGGKDLEELKGVAIPVQVSGTFAEPRYQVKLDTVVKDAAKKEIKKKVKKKLEKKLEKQFGDTLKGLLR